MRFVLGEHQYFPYARVQAVGQGEVDDPVFSAEGYRWFRTEFRQWLQTVASTAGKNDR